MDPRHSGTKYRAATDNLFKVDKDCEKLSPNNAKRFHNLLFKTLYNTNRDSPHACTSVSFLNNIVRGPYIDNWRKLDHLMKYPRKTGNLPLIMGNGGAKILKWWIYASFAVCNNTEDIPVEDCTWEEASKL